MIWRENKDCKQDATKTAYFDKKKRERMNTIRYIFQIKRKIIWSILYKENIIYKYIISKKEAHRKE